VIAGFVEGFKNVKKLIAVAELAAERGKPIVSHQDRALGIRDAGGALAHGRADRRRCAERRHVPAVRHHPRAGLRRAAGDLVLLANIKKPRKPGISVVSHSGGISSLTADMLGHAGLTLPPLSDRARDGINAILKDFGWAANPADITGFRAQRFVPQIMDYMIEEPDVGTLVIASAGQGNRSSR
jgi:acyl-CoA synthetase (NDP forming)